MQFNIIGYVVQPSGAGVIQRVLIAAGAATDFIQPSRPIKIRLNAKVIVTFSATARATPVLAPLVDLKPLARRQCQCLTRWRAQGFCPVAAVLSSLSAAVVNTSPDRAA